MTFIRCPVCNRKHNGQVCYWCQAKPPSPDEIAEATRLIRATWTPEEEQERLVDAYKRQPALVPLVHRPTDHMVRRDKAGRAMG